MAKHGKKACDEKKNVTQSEGVITGKAIKINVWPSSY